MSLDTAIIIVNYNGWQETVRCIDASLNMDYFDGVIFVCDNASTNQSFEKITEWANGFIAVDADMVFENVMQTSHEKKYRPHVAGSIFEIESEILKSGLVKNMIYIIQADKNGGFSYGNNVGIKLAMLSPRVDLFWMLNSDALPAKSAYKELKKQCVGKPFPIFSGSVVCEYWNSNVIQSMGGVKPSFPFQKFKTIGARHLLDGEFISRLPTVEVESVMFPMGCSMLINRCYVLECGLLDERFFLYCEELDLAARCESSNIYVCVKSIVYHKGGSSTGQSYKAKIRHEFSDYHFIRSRWLLAKKLGSLQVVGVLIFTLHSFLKRLLLGEFRIAFNVIKSSYDGLFKTNSDNFDKF